MSGLTGPVARIVIKHERKVALRVLEPELAAVVGAERSVHGRIKPRCFDMSAEAASFQP